MILIRKISLSIFVVAIVHLSHSTLLCSSPSINSLNDQMSRLEKLLGIPSSDQESDKETVIVEPQPIKPQKPVPEEASVLPASLQGIEKKLIELESMVSNLPNQEIVQEVEMDPWDEVDLNASLPPEALPKVEVSNGMVVRYIPGSNSFLSVNEGDLIKTLTLVMIPLDSELVVSFEDGSVIRLDENSRVVIGPPVDGAQLVDLRNGTISVLAKEKGETNDRTPFVVRTKSATFETNDSFFAVTEYLGQTFIEVKSGEVNQYPKRANKIKFVSYLNRPASISPLGIIDQNTSN